MNHDVGRSHMNRPTNGKLTAVSPPSHLSVSPSSGACRAAELRESSTGGAALQRGLAARSDRTAGATQDGDSAAAAAPATLGTCLQTGLMFWSHVLVSCSGLMFWSHVLVSCSGLMFWSHTGD